MKEEARDVKLDVTFDGQVKDGKIVGDCKALGSGEDGDLIEAGGKVYEVLLDALYGVLTRDAESNGSPAPDLAAAVFLVDMCVRKTRDLLIKKGVDLETVTDFLMMMKEEETEEHDGKVS